MDHLQHLHECMKARRLVLLDDGTIGRIVRLDTAFPERNTTVSVWIERVGGPCLAKVDIQRVVGVAPQEASA